METTETLLTSLTLDYEEFSEAIEGANGEMRLTARDEAPWLQDLLSIDGIVLQVMQEGGANTYVAETADEWVTGVFGLPAPVRVSINGRELAPGRLALIRPGEVVTSSSTGVNRWCSISIPYERFIQSLDRFDASATERVMSGSASLRISPTSSQSVVSLVERIMGVAKAGHGLESHTGARAAKAELLSAFVGAVASSATGRASGFRRRRSHARIIRLVHESLEAADSCCSVEDLAARAGISERTLRIVFAENFGVSPKHLLILRQLHAVRRDLRRASPGETVTEVAMRHGAWELGRLAQRYKYLFGESPSETIIGLH